ncbi:helix-turn-helix domain-containing protein [Marinobacterium stanieri]|uniref:DNA-binding response regulator, NarL/FixJ family, contains REC and HTH domains n=1 Tax=Marinobacterium stanieri TaxID=49186 RepID=A0A1N6NUR0_9GAMM|nr:LuxR C-terminal-related transcriptional regulator [Marinobacterium stanieri]SIP95834.1 DNA-binding response regulator, NarL/FixJ family, contains REC and HTH domains [Marinobacterium stanieri]
MRFKKIMLADPNTLSREGLKRLLGSRDPSFIFVEAADDDDFDSAAHSHNGFDLIIVHASLLAVGQSPDLTAYLYKTRTSIVLICDELSPALDAKIKCFDIKAAISCQDPMGQIEQRILDVLEQQAYTENLLDSLSLSSACSGAATLYPSLPVQRETIHSRLESLTAKQKVVLSYLKAGLMNKEIAAEMGIQESTVKRHVSDILQKLELKKRTQLINGVTV